MCATCIGSTFSHRPLPGVRKSGIPDGTEMPAPVSATTELAPRTSSARRAERGEREEACGAERLAAFKARRPFGEKGSDPLAGISALKGRGKRPLLRLYARVEIARGGDLFDLLERQRGLACELARPRQRRVEQLVIVDHAVDEPQLEGFVGQDRVADGVHLERLAEAG